MTTSQSRYQESSPELDRICADQLFEGQPTTSRSAEGPPPPPPNRPPPYELPLPPVPPPQFGRLTHSIRSSEAARARVSSGSRPQVPFSQTEPPTPVSHHEPGSQSVPREAHGVVGAPQSPGPLAGFGARTVSFLIDYVAPVVVLNLLLAIGAGTGGTAWRLMLVAGGSLWLLGFCLWNSGYLQGTTGRSLGRRVANTKLVGIETGEPVGFGRAVARQVCHLVEFGIGYLWPLWDAKRQTFADKIFGTVVVDGEDRGGTDHRRVGE